MNFNRVFVTGDTHGDFSWLQDWCAKRSTTTDDALIILGDAGILYYGEKSKKERQLKSFISALPITILCVRGNHEDRPENRTNMTFVELDEPKLVANGYYFDVAYPNIHYISDGSVISINDMRCLFIGGAYSVDKYYRIENNLTWFKDEELSDDEMHNICDKVKGKTFDFVFTHTCPEEWMPRHLFLSEVDKSMVPLRTEKFLTDIANNIKFSNWFFGHFHADIPNWGERIAKINAEQGKISLLFWEVYRII